MYSGYSEYSGSNSEFWHFIFSYLPYRCVFLFWRRQKLYDVTSPKAIRIFSILLIHFENYYKLLIYPDSNFLQNPSAILLSWALSICGTDYSKRLNFKTHTKNILFSRRIKITGVGNATWHIGAPDNRGTWFSHLPKTWQSIYLSSFVTIRDHLRLFAVFGDC